MSKSCHVVPLSRENWRLVTPFLSEVVIESLGSGGRGLLKSVLILIVGGSASIISEKELVKP